jgi:hypothetical protein
MAARQAQAAWLDSAMHHTTIEMRIARTRVERLARKHKELNDRVDYQTRQIVELDRANERLRRANFMLVSILRLMPTQSETTPTILASYMA